MSVQRDSLGRFVKGVVPWNKRKKGVYSEEMLRRMSDAKKGKRMSPATEFKKGHTPWDKGMKGLYINGSEKGWFKKGHKWPKEIEQRMRKKIREKVLIKPNLEMNEDLAYVLGVLFGDGCVFKNGKTYNIVLDITNRSIALSFMNSLKNIGLNPSVRERMPSNGIGKLKKYIVIAYSINFGQWYKSLSINKLKRLLNNKSVIISFIREFYESEGSLYVDKRKYKTITISMYNTNLELIKLLHLLTKKMGFNFNLNGPYKNNKSFAGEKAKPIYRISTSIKKNVYEFMDIVNPVAKNLGVDINGRI